MKDLNIFKNMNPKIYHSGMHFVSFLLTQCVLMYHLTYFFPRTIEQEATIISPLYG